MNDLKQDFSRTPGVAAYQDDIPDWYVAAASRVKLLAWDIETSGLDWRRDRIGVCQLYAPGETIAIVRTGNIVPQGLKSLLADGSIRKVFHHAMFDLRFMSFHWQVLPDNIACTKIAAKLLDGANAEEHSLQAVLKRYLGVTIDKRERLSNWLASELTGAQISYAAADVRYLTALLEVLERGLAERELLQLAHACFAHIPTRVQLDIQGYGDVYSYNSAGGGAAEDQNGFA